MPKQEPQSELDRYIAAAQDLRELNREAHETLKAIKEERRLYREDFERLAKLREDWLSSKDLEKRIVSMTEKTIKDYLDHLIERMHEIEESVYRRFDAITAICLGEDPISVKEGKETVFNLMRRYIKGQKLPIRITEEVHIEMSRETAAGDHALRGFLAKGDFTDIRHLPILYDSRIPRNMAYLVVPPVNDSDTRTVYEINIVTGIGAWEAVEAINDYGRRKYQSEKAALARVPAAFRRKDPK